MWKGRIVWNWRFYSGSGDTPADTEPLNSSKYSVNTPDSSTCSTLIFEGELSHNTSAESDLSNFPESSANTTNGSTCSTFIYEEDQFNPLTFVHSGISIH